jgi:hypothetical protein
MPYSKTIKRLKQDGLTAKDILVNLLPDLVEDISAEWGLVEDRLSVCDLSLPRSSDLISGKKQLLEGANTTFGLVSILESGDVYKIKIETEETGEVTWNGDDACFKDFKISIIDSQYLETIHNIKNLQEVTEEILERIACEVIAVLYE